MLVQRTSHWQRMTVVRHVQVGGHTMLMQQQQQGIPGQSGHPGQLDNQQLMQNSQLGYYIPQQPPQQQQQQLTPHQQQETYQQNWQLGQTLSQQQPIGLSSGLTYVGVSPEVESALKAAHEAYRKSEFMQALQLCHAVSTGFAVLWILPSVCLYSSAYLFRARS